MTAGPSGSRAAGEAVRPTEATALGAFEGEDEGVGDAAIVVRPTIAISASATPRLKASGKLARERCRFDVDAR